MTPPNIPKLEDPVVKPGLALTSLLRDTDDKVVGFASELEYFPDGQRPGVDWQAYWTIFLPDRGSIYGFETEAIPETHIPPFVQLAEGKAWMGEIRAKIASGPREDGFGVIVGGTGEFEGATGKLAEFFVLRELRLDGAIIGTLELEIHLD